VEIALVDEGDVHGGPAQRARRVEPAEPTAENDDAMRDDSQDSGAMADSSVNSRTKGLMDRKAAIACLSRGMMGSKKAGDFAC
jgi:hypothetical protein